MRLKGIASGGGGGGSGSGTDSTLTASRLSHAGWLGITSTLFVVHRNAIYWSDQQADWTSHLQLVTTFQDSPQIKVALPDWSYSGAQFILNYSIAHVTILWNCRRNCQVEKFSLAQFQWPLASLRSAQLQR